MVSIKFWRGKFSRPATGYECIAHALAFDRGVMYRTPRSNAGACAMHSYPVAGRENFPRQNLIDTISESVSREKKLNDSD